MSQDEAIVKDLSKTMEGALKDKVGKPFSKRYFIFTLFLAIAAIVGIFLFTNMILVQLIVIFYIVLSFFISIVHYSNHKVLKPFNRLIRYLLPINEERIKAGPTNILRFLYMTALGIIIALIGYTGIQLYLPDLAPKGYGFFTFIWSAGPLMPLLIFGIIMLCPSLFCVLFMWTSFTYKDVRPVRYARLIVFMPVLFFFPTLTLIFYNLTRFIFIFGSTLGIMVPIIPSNLGVQLLALLYVLLPFLLFLGGWAVTLALWYGRGKRNMLICLGIGFTQALASLFVFYNVIIRQLAFGLTISPWDFLTPVFLVWVGVLVLIPIILKGFDKLAHGKYISVGLILSIILAFAFQSWTMYYYFSDLILIIPAQDVQLFLGLGYLYYYFFLFLLPLFFLFGYFQIVFIKSIYRTLRDYGAKHEGALKYFLKVMGIVVAIVLLIFWIVIYYFILYVPWDPSKTLFQIFLESDYMYSLLSIGLVLTGGLFFMFNLINLTIIPWFISGLMTFDIFLPITLLVTLLFMLYATFRSAHNLASESDRIGEEERIMRIFTDKTSYKARVIFGFALVTIFIGTIAIYSFLILYYNTLYNLSPTIYQIPLNISRLFLGVIDNMKLIISIFGFVAGIFLFFKYMRR